MAFVYVFKLPHGTKQDYDKVVAALDAEGMASPPGRLYHFAGPMQGGWQVTDVWKSKEELDKFQEELAKILERLNIPMPHVEASTADIVLENEHVHKPT